MGHFAKIRAVDVFNQIYLRVKKAKEDSQNINKIAEELDYVLHRVENLQETGILEIYKKKISEDDLKFLKKLLSNNNESFRNFFKSLKELNDKKIVKHLESAMINLDKISEMRPYFMDLGLGDKNVEGEKKNKILPRA